MLELTVGSETHVGKSLGHDSEVCWIAQQDGRVTRVPLQNVSSFRKIDDRFRSLETIEVRNRLRREFGHGWEIVGTGHYLVCAPNGRGQLFANTFEDVYRSFRSYFSRRGFELPQPEFPLIAVVYPTEQSFAANCANDEVPFAPGLKGYYHRLTNRTSLFESQDDQLVDAALPHAAGGLLADLIPNRRHSVDSLSTYGTASLAGALWDGNVEGDLKDTIVHEATHQVAYNLGLHTRIGDNPKWITEGLATMFEAEGTRKNAGGGRPQQRLNLERFEQFATYVERRRNPGALAEFITNDRLFQTATLDAYAQAWALTFYLAETRSAQHAKFLKSVSARDPLKSYSPEERLADFQRAFGDDLNRLDVAFVRFLEDLR
ncbi:MAG: DUF1570 domain-containing protein [Planctomycetaceae bacterium]